MSSRTSSSWNLRSLSGIWIDWLTFRAYYIIGIYMVPMTVPQIEN
jgi:hypothetical protein